MFENEYPPQLSYRPRPSSAARRIFGKKSHPSSVPSSASSSFAAAAAGRVPPPQSSSARRSTTPTTSPRIEQQQQQQQRSTSSSLSTAATLSSSLTAQPHYSPRLACRILDAYPLSLSAQAQRWTTHPHIRSHIDHTDDSLKKEAGDGDSSNNEKKKKIEKKEAPIAFSAEEVAEIVNAALRQAGRKPMFPSHDDVHHERRASTLQQQQQEHIDNLSSAMQRHFEHHQQQSLGPAAAAAAPFHAAQRLQKRFDGMFSRHMPALAENADALADVDTIIKTVLDFDDDDDEAVAAAAVSGDPAAIARLLDERIERGRKRRLERPPSGGKQQQQQQKKTMPIPRRPVTSSSASSSFNRRSSISVRQSSAEQLEEENKKLAAARAELGLMGDGQQQQQQGASSFRGRSGTRLRGRSGGKSSKERSDSNMMSFSQDNFDASSSGMLRISVDSPHGGSQQLDIDSPPAAAPSPRRRAQRRGSDGGSNNLGETFRQGMSAYLDESQEIDAQDAEEATSPVPSARRHTAVGHGGSGAAGGDSLPVPKSQQMQMQQQTAKMQRLLAATSTAAQHLILYREAMENELTCPSCLGLLSDPQVMVLCGHTACRRCCEQMRVGTFAANADAQMVAEAAQKQLGLKAGQIRFGGADDSSLDGEDDDDDGDNDDGFNGESPRDLNEVERGEAIQLFPNRRDGLDSRYGNYRGASNIDAGPNTRTWYRCSVCKILSDEGYVPNHALAHIRARFQVNINGLQAPEKTLENFAEAISHGRK